MTMLSTHVLDLNRGMPAQDLPVILEFRDDCGEWRRIASGQTDQNGRCTPMPNNTEVAPGVYRLIFDTAGYFSIQHVTCFYPVVLVTFAVLPDHIRLHLPLLLSPYGYTTYRGS